MGREHHEPAPHLTALDHILARTRKECHWLAEEERWEAAGTYPPHVHRSYLHDHVFQRDSARMISLGYRVETAERCGTDDAEVRVVYARR